MANINTLWTLVDPLSIHDAAALIAGYDPNIIDCQNWRFRDSGEKMYEAEAEAFDWYSTAFIALRSAVISQRIPVEKRFDAKPRYTATGTDTLDWRDKDYFFLTNEGVQYVIDAEPSWAKTTVNKADLIAWLEANNCRPAFFFPEEDSKPAIPAYLDPKHPRYSPKLAAAVQAWEAVTSTQGKTPKQALEKWLRENASRFGMTDDDGNAVSQAIEDCSKVANWKPGGGAPTTPSK